MELTELLNNIKAIQVTGEVRQIDIDGIFYDSRKVIKNSVFVAIKGYKTDGHHFILDALNRGAVAVVLEDNIVPEEIFTHQMVAKILVRNSRIALAEISNVFFKEPSKKLRLIGITGTNGKTTTSYFIKSIFEYTGEKVGLIGTIANYIGDKEITSALTTPESNDLNELLFEMYNEGCKSAVMEVSSHSLVLQRVRNVHFSAAVFTNITSDHMDFHGTFENYLYAKKKLFDILNKSAFGVYNCDDKNSFDLISDSRAKLFSYGTSSNADFILKDIKYNLNGTYFIVEHKASEYSISTSLVGEFNAYNACAAFAVALVFGIEEKKAIEGIKKTKQVPGRFEVLGKGDKKVIIDYSHTADSLEKTLLAIKSIVKDKVPVYTVFGCGGNRDRTKRPLMGEIATNLSQKVIITSDNPRFEDPYEIMEEIKSGIEKVNYEMIENREEAISYAIANSEENAVILVAGKGHENYQEVKGIRKHFSDKEIAEKYLSTARRI